MTHTTAHPARRVWLSAVISIAAFFMLAVCSTLAAAATIRVTPDRNPVALNESFNLVFSASEKPDDDPDFSPLEKDFRIVSQGQSSQVSIVNGRFSRTTEWTLTLMPKVAGTFTIPPVSFGSDRSEETGITVQASTEETAAAPSELTLEVQAEPRNPYVQAQVRFTLRVLRRVNFSGAELSEPVIPDALVERLGEDRAYQAERGGQQYGVIERQYAVFPQKSGPLKIEPLTLEAQIPGGGRSRFNSFFGQGSRVARVQSKAVELNVRPIPPGFTGKHWLPAESVELDESWSQSPPQTSVGEPITRTVTLRAKGATVGVLPELDTALAGAIGERAKLYPDQPALNEEKKPGGIVSSRQEKIAILPGKAGNLVLPAIEVSWWNTRADRMEVARVPERTLAVVGGPEPVAASPAAETQATRETVIEATPAPLALPGESSASLTANPWFWASLVACSGWLATALAWMLGRRPAHPQDQRREESMAGLRAAGRAARDACAAGDPCRARDALLAWAAIRWREDPPRSLGALAGRLGGDFAGELSGLENALYGRSSGSWDGSRLARLVSERPGAASATPTDAPELEPLYRG